VIIHKFWFGFRKDGYEVKDKWLREGWFLLGFIPLYIRDRENRAKF